MSGIVPRNRWMLPVADRAGSPDVLTDWVDGSWAPLSPKDFGAKMDGVADDTAAWVSLTAALTAAGGGIVVVDGPTVLASPLVFTVPVRIVGQCPLGVLPTINYTGLGVALTWDFAPAATYLMGPGIRDCVVSGPGAATATTGLGLGLNNGCLGFEGHNVRVVNFGTAVLPGTGAFLFTFYNSMFQACTQLFNGQIAGGSAGENCRFVDCTFSNAATRLNAVQVKAGSPWQLRFSRCSFDNAQLAIAGGRVFCTDCHFEDPGVPGDYRLIDITNGVVSLANCSMRQDDAAATATELVGIAGGTLYACGTQAAAAAAFPRVFFADLNSTVVLVSTTLLSNLTVEFVENGAHQALYVSSMGCVNGFGNTDKCSADQGDASTTFTYGGKEQIVLFNTPLTANRTFTLNNNGTTAGAKVRVIRTAASTGASTLTVQDQVPTAIKVLAAGQWADFVWNSQTNKWIESAFGSL